MQDQPAAARLLEAVADTLETRVLPAADPELRHEVRVAASLCRIVQREITLDPESDVRAAEALGTLLGHAGTSRELWAELATRLDGETVFVPGDEATRAVLLSIVCDKLAVAKPGYDHSAELPRPETR